MSPFILYILEQFIADEYILQTNMRYLSVINIIMMIVNYIISSAPLSSSVSSLYQAQPDQGAGIKFSLIWAQGIWVLAKTPQRLSGILFLEDFVVGYMIPGEEVHIQVSFHSSEHFGSWRRWGNCLIELNRQRDGLTCLRPQ